MMDQDAAITNAIKDVFLESKCHWCIWYILKKAEYKLGQLKRKMLISLK